MSSVLNISAAVPASMPKFLRVYASLSGLRQRKFAQWLTIRMRDSHKHLLALMEHISANIQGIISRYRAETADRDAWTAAAWAVMFPEKPYNNIAFNREVTDLMFQLESFMVEEYLRQHETERRLLLVSAYQDMGLMDIGLNILPYIQQGIQKIPAHSPHYFRHKYDLAQWELHAVMNEPREVQMPKVKALLGEFSTYIAVEYLRIMLLRYQMKISEDESLVGQEAVLAEISRNTEIMQMPIVQCYWQVMELYRLFIADNQQPATPQGILTCLTYLAKCQRIGEAATDTDKEKTLSAEQQHELYWFLRNLAIQWYNANMSNAANEFLWEFYQRTAEYGLLLVQGMLLFRDYRSIVRVATRLFDTEAECNTFFDKYQLYEALAQHRKHETKFLTEIYFLIQKQEYKTAQKRIVEFGRFQNTYYRIEAQCLLVEAMEASKVYLTDKAERKILLRECIVGKKWTTKSRLSATEAAKFIERFDKIRNCLLLPTDAQ